MRCWVVGALIASALAACWRGQTATRTSQTEQTDQTEQTVNSNQPVLVAAPRGKTPPPDEGSQGYLIAGCNTGCTGCAIGKATDVHGVDVKTGKELFPHPNTGGGGGYSCGARMPVGAHVRLIAKSGDGLVLDHWRPFNADDYCPCAGTNQTVCDVKVTQEIAAKFTRVYCGAEWKPQGAAQIGH